MRLAIVNQFYRPDVAPTGHLAASVAEHRAALGDEVTVITSLGGYIAPATGRDISCAEDAAGDRKRPRVYRIWTPQLGKQSLAFRLLDYLIFYVGAMWRVATLPSQDIIVSLTTPPYIAWTAVLHKLFHHRTRIVLWSMDCYPDVAERSGVIRHGGWLSRCLRAVNRMLFRRVDRLVCLDGAMVELLCSQYALRRGGQTRPAATVIPNWEDGAMFPGHALTNGHADSATIPSTDREFTLLYLGNTGVGHEFETALDAADAMRVAGDRVKFVFIGGGSRWAEIAREKQRRGLENVSLRGYIPKEETPAVMQSAGAALITLRDEALGVMSPSKLHANLAMGLPVIYIGPRGSNVDEALTRFECGVSLRRGDVEGVVHFVRRLIADSQLHQEMRRRARRAFDEAYCDVQTLPQFDRLFDAMLASPAR